PPPAHPHVPTRRSSDLGTTGQRCTAASRMIVQRGVAADFVNALKQRAETLRIGDGLQEGVQVGPIVNQRQLERVHGYTGVARGEDRKSTRLNSSHQIIS